MPAGLLLSPTARTVRSGPFEESPVGAVPFSVMRRPSSGLQLRRFPPYRPQSRLPPAPSPARWLGQRHGHRPPIPSRVPLWLPSPAWGDTHTSCPAPSHGSIAPGVFLRPLSQAILPLFSPAGPPSQRCVRPAPSRPEDCALNQHFPSHPGTFVQRKMIL